jgi:dTDP-4-amino-4,6-dideoxygalactose transaminase
MTESLIPVMRPRLPNAAALRPYLEEIDRNNWYSNFGPLERRLEERLAERYDLPAKNVVAVANCTAGLMLALVATARERGGYCIMPSYTFVASAHAVLAAGLIPLFIDVDPESWAATPDLVSSAVRGADGPVAAVMVVSPFGAPVDAAMWDAFTDGSGVPVVIDAAAGFDSAAAARSPVVVSLHATKVLGAGEGGFVMSRDAALVGEIAARSNFGFRTGRQAEAIGFNGKLNEYCAAVGLASLDAWPRTRPPLIELMRRYRDILEGIGGVRTSPGFGDGWVGGTCNVRFDRPVADEAVAMLGDAGIDSRQWWTKGCHRETAFAGYPHDTLPVTDDLAERVLGLPFHDGLGEADFERVAKALRAIARG